MSQCRRRSSDSRQISTRKSTSRLTEVTVRTLTGSSHRIEVEDVDTVLLLKEKIFKVFHVAPPAQNLIGFGDQHLEDKKKMIDYGVEEDSVVWLIPDRDEAGEPITVFVTGRLNTRVPVTTRSHSTVWALKKKIEEAGLASAEKQRLFVDGNEGLDGMCLSHAGIVHGVEIQMRIANWLTLRVYYHWTEKEYEVTVDSNDKVFILKAMLKKLIATRRARSMRLTYEDIALEDEQIIGSYNIPNNGMITT